MTKAESFRPLTGDLSSLHEKSGHKATEKRFPSPYRGLIFLTMIIWTMTKFRNLSFPSPYRGLIFLTEAKSGNDAGYGRVSVPLQGTYLPYVVKKEVSETVRMGFRPLTGDLSSLREKDG